MLRLRWGMRDLHQSFMTDGRLLALIHAPLLRLPREHIVQLLNQTFLRSSALKGGWHNVV